MTTLQQLTYRQLLWGATFISAFSAVQSQAQETQDSRTLTPKQLVVAFGEPVFLPIATVNDTNGTVEAVSLTNHTPDLIVKVTSGEHVHLLNFLPGMSGGGGIDLPAHSVQDAVLLVNLWSPGFAKEFLRTQQATLQLEFKESTIAETELVLEGSAFLPAFQRQLFNWLQDAETPMAGYGHGKYPGSTYGAMFPLSPFSIGVTPLSWQANQRQASRWFDPLSAENQAASKGILPTGRVARMREIGMLLDQMQDCKTFAAWKSIFFEFDELLEQCDVSERQWYLGAFSTDRWWVSRGTEEEKMEHDNMLRRAYPDYAMCFFGNGSYARFSLIRAH